MRRTIHVLLFLFGCLFGISVFADAPSSSAPYVLPYTYNGTTYTKALQVITLSNDPYGPNKAAIYFYNGTAKFNAGYSVFKFFDPKILLVNSVDDVYGNGNDYLYEYVQNPDDPFWFALANPVCFDDPYLKASSAVYQEAAFDYQNPSYHCGFHFVDTSTVIVQASGYFTGDFFRYPVEYTPANPNGWSHKVQSFGSLNNSSAVPHAAEDWNLNTGTCTDIGKPLVSIADGVVADITLGNSSDGWGKTILIRHDAPAGKYFLTSAGQSFTAVYSLYAHMLKYGQDASYSQSLDIQQGIGQLIKKGDPVGQVGTGDGQYAGACHLHFAILTDGSYVYAYRSLNPYSWSSMAYFTNPSELIDNGLYSAQSTAPFTIVVHPYECGGTFRLNGNAPLCNPTSVTIGNWTRQKGSQQPGYPELGYGGIIYSKPANKVGTVVWAPNLPRDGRYRVSVYIPNSSTYATSTKTSYCVAQNGVCGSPVTINQSSTAARGKWTDIGTYSLYRNASPQVMLDGNTGESGKTVAVDVVKFEYLGPIQ